MLAWRPCHQGGSLCPAGFGPACLAPGRGRDFCLGTAASSHRGPFLIQELLLELESETQKREHEFRLQADRMSNEVLTHELKVRRPSGRDSSRSGAGRPPLGRAVG